MSGGPGTNDPGRIRYGRITMSQLVMAAWGVQLDQIIGPNWIRDFQGHDIYNDLPVYQQWVAESHSVMVRIPKVGSMEVRLTPVMREGVQLRLKRKAPGGGDIYLCLRILAGLEEPSTGE